MAFQLNQFKTAEGAGIVMNPNPSTINVRLSSSFVGTAKAGDVVKLAATDVGSLPVVVAAVSGDAGYGVILFNPKKATYAANDVTEIALAGSIVTMIASTGFNRGTTVAWNSVSGQIQSTTGNFIGTALDVAGVTGDVVSVFVQPKLY